MDKIKKKGNSEIPLNHHIFIVSFIIGRKSREGKGTKAFFFFIFFFSDLELADCDLSHSTRLYSSAETTIRQWVCGRLFSIGSAGTAPLSLFSILLSLVSSVLDFLVLGFVDWIVIQYWYICFRNFSFFLSSYECRILVLLVALCFGFPSYSLE